MTNCTYIGNTTYSNATCCNKPAVHGKSYCKDHVFLVYKEGSNIQRKKDTKRYDRIQQLVDDFNQALEELEAEGWTPEWDGSVS